MVQNNGNGDKPIVNQQEVNQGANTGQEFSAQIKSAQSAVAEAVVPQSGQFTLGDVLSDAWNAYKENFGIVFSTFLVMMIIVAVVSNIPLAHLFVAPHLSVGMSIIALRAIRKDEPPEFSDLFKGFSIYVPVLVANIVFTLFVGIGSLLLVVPGIILALMYGQIFFLFADQKMAIDEGKASEPMGWWDTMKRSSEIMNGYKLKLFGHAIVLMLIAAAGALAFGIGALFTAPFAMLGFAAFYNRLPK